MGNCEPKDIITHMGNFEPKDVIIEWRLTHIAFNNHYFIKY